MSGLLQSDLSSGISVKQQRNENDDRSDTRAMWRLLKVCQTITRISEYSKATWQRRHNEIKKHWIYYRNLPIPVATCSKTWGFWECGLESCRRNGCLSLLSVVRSPCDEPILLPEDSYRVCMCVSLSVISYNNNPLHLQWIRRKRSN
jgi:hypothetical protein